MDLVGHPFGWNDTETHFGYWRWKSYNAKVKKGINTVEDDTEFVKSEKAEKQRLAGLKAEFEDARGYSDDDNSDGGVFVSTAPTARTSHVLY